MELFVQTYLRSGKSLEDLRIEYGVKSFVQNGKVSLSYDQLEAKNSDPLSQQCRGLILRADTFDIVACPMFRFFNLEQEDVCAPVDWKNARYEDKADGSLIILYYDFVAMSWYVATRSRPEANVPMDEGGLTFNGLFNIALQAMYGNNTNSPNEFMSGVFEEYKNKTFCIELTSPLNRIVCEYNEPKLTLLAVRDNLSMWEEDPKPYADALDLPLIKTYSSNYTIKDMIEVVKQFNPKHNEGIVVKDNNFNRVKVKSPAYVALNHMRDSLATSYRGCIEIVLLGKEDDVIGMLPELITNRIIRFKNAIQELFKITEMDYAELKDIVDMKTYALAAKEKLWPAALFALKRNKTPSLISFACGKEIAGKISQGNLDMVMNLCEKINPNIYNI